MKPIFSFAVLWCFTAICHGAVIQELSISIDDVPVVQSPANTNGLITETFEIDIDVSSISAGQKHILQLQAVDSSNQASIEFQLPWFSSGVIAGNIGIDSVEVFLNTDPGQGGGVQLELSSTGDIAVMGLGRLSLVEEPQGLNTLYIRVKDNVGDWSRPFGLPFVFTPVLPEKGTRNLVEAATYQLLGDSRVEISDGLGDESGEISATEFITPVPQAVFYNFIDSYGNSKFSAELDSVLATDSDRDGLPDKWERMYFQSLFYRGEDDPNGNGVSNFEEFFLGDDPGNPMPSSFRTISGTVFQDGVAMASIPVCLEGFAALDCSAVTDQHGQYEFGGESDLPPGDWTVYIRERSQFTSTPDQYNVALMSESIENLDFALGIAGTSAPVYPAKRLYQTRYGAERSEDFDNVWLNSYEDPLEKNAFVTHVLYPYQNEDPKYNSGSHAGFRWYRNADTGYGQISPLVPQAGIVETTDTRQPLILVHGWQGNCDHQTFGDTCFDKENRDPEVLAGATDGDYSDKLHVERYWDTFIRYFAQSDELKNQYRLYIYRYPSYKHITFNGRILSDLISHDPYINSWLQKPNSPGVSILAHSMGGLVSRALLEQHGISIRLATGESFHAAGVAVLDQLITLATPHHGSPAAIPSWINFDSVADKDLQTPGSWDLWWDGEDDAFIDLDTVEDLGDKEAQVISSIMDRASISEFDQLYRVKLQEEGGLRVPEFRFSQGGDQVFRQPNPWLSWMNRRYRGNENVWSDKYIFYAGFDAFNFGLQNLDLNNTLKDDIFGFATNEVLRLGYYSDSVVPVTSAILETNALVPDILLGGWPDSPKISSRVSEIANMIEVEGSSDRVLFTFNNGHQVRIFKDYHHDRMLNGAYFGEFPLISKSELMAPPSILGSWEPLSFSGKCEKDSADVDYDRFSTAFRDGSGTTERFAYVGQVAETDFDLTLLGSLKLSNFATRCNQHPDALWLSTLQFEPLYLAISNDLLRNLKQDDKDFDGIVNSEDNCPVVANPEQVNTDQDLFGDACDEDDDNDGVVDGEDSAPLNPAICQDLDADMCDDCSGLNGNDIENDGMDTDTDGLCDLGDVDDDNDGWNDEIDNCPLIANPLQEDSNMDGVGDDCSVTEGICIPVKTSSGIVSLICL